MTQNPGSFPPWPAAIFNDQLEARRARPGAASVTWLDEAGSPVDAVWFAGPGTRTITVRFSATDAEGLSPASSTSIASASKSRSLRRRRASVEMRSAGSERPPPGPVTAVTDGRGPRGDAPRMLFRPLVLCVDDEPLLASALARLLRGWGAEVLTAPNGREALELLARTAARPDLIFTDLVMPVLDGEGLLRALRADPALASIPVVVLSASRTEERAAAYVPKPFTAGEVRAVFDALCPPTQLQAPRRVPASAA